jgi:hypothetical protein
LAQIQDVLFDFIIKNKLNSNSIRLNSSSGDLFCTGGSQINNFESYEIEVNWWRQTSPNSKFYYKTILLYLEVYNSNHRNNNTGSSNEKLVFELKTQALNNSSSDYSLPPMQIWTIPELISRKYETCLIIAGNLGSRFYLDRKLSHQLILLYQPDLDAELNYQIILRCFSSNVNEIDIQLNIDLSELRKMWRNAELPLLFVEKSVYEVDLNVESFRLDKPVLKLNPNRTIQADMYTFTRNNSGLIQFFESLFTLNTSNGDLKLDINDFNKYLQYCTLNSNNNNFSPPRISNAKLNILLPIKLSSQNRNHVMSFVKVNPNCNGTNLNLRFKKPYYIIRVSGGENLAQSSKLLEVVSVLDELKSVFNSITYHFCEGLVFSKFSDL